jgi:hypothetical protein
VLVLTGNILPACQLKSERLDANDKRANTQGTPFEQRALFEQRILFEQRALFEQRTLFA